MGRKSKESQEPTSQITASPANSMSSSSSLSDFEFTLSISPRKASANLCPADELFYKGQILPLQLSPRLSMVRTLTNSSTDRSRDSTGSSNSTDSNNSSSSSSSSGSTELLLRTECDSARLSSFSEDDDLTRRMLSCPINNNRRNTRIKKLKYFSLPRFPSVFSRKEGKNRGDHQEQQQQQSNNVKSVKKMSASAKEMVRRYLKKVKPLYEKLSHKQHQNQNQEQKIWANSTDPSRNCDERSNVTEISNNGGSRISHSFSGNLRYPMRRRSSYGSSCPSSIRSSPSHSGVLCGNRVGVSQSIVVDSSSMEELQNAIQGAIAHCKQSLSRQLSLESK